MLVIALAACRVKSDAQRSSPAASVVPATEAPPPTAIASATAPGIGLGAGSLSPQSLSVGDPPPRVGPDPKGNIGSGALSVSGRLPAEVIQRAVRQNLGKLRACYESGLTRNPKLGGKVVVRFVIGQDGAVSSATSDPETTLTDAAVVSCVVDGFKKIAFPAPEGGIVTVVYPLTFSNPE